jgi:hypothetical protein
LRVPPPATARFTVDSEQTTARATSASSSLTAHPPLSNSKTNRDTQSHDRANDNQRLTKNLRGSLEQAVRDRTGRDHPPLTAS